MGNFKRKTSRKNIKQVKHNMRCKNSLENELKIILNRGKNNAKLN